MKPNRNVSLAERAHKLSNGIELAYYDSQAANAGPSAEALVLLHGYCGSSAYWERVAGVLAAGGRVIAPDARGHGLSSAPEDAVYGMENFAADLEELLERLGVARAIVLGHSLGGYIALAYAERHAARLSAFGLIHSTPLPDSVAAKENRDKAAAAIEGQGVEPFVKGLVPKLFNPERSGELAEELERAVQIGRGTSQRGAAATARGMKARRDRKDVIAGASVPVLLAAGSNDGIIPQESVFAASAPRTVQAVISGAGHMSMYERPDELISAVSSFREQI